MRQQPITWKLLDQIEMQYDELEQKIKEHRATNRDIATHNSIVWLINIGR